MSLSPSSSSDRTSTAVPTVYQLRAVVHGISPLIWRRLLVPAAASIAELHTILQTAFGWAGEHLHRFVIHGTEYGIAYLGTPGFRDDARQVHLGELGLRLGEKFTYTYTYNYFAGWTCGLRVEQITDAQPGRTYPRCTGGRRAGPPEEWEGPWAFVEQTQPYLVFEAMLRAAEIVGQLLDADENTELASVIGAAERDELASLLPLLGLECFDPRALNHALAARTLAPREARA
jgi:Plasmid pRiA4b ORF-3-like protein